MVPLFRGEQPGNWRKDWLYEYYEYPGPHNVRKNRGVRTDRYKLIHYYEPPEEFELYDLQEDPGELHNLYGQASHADLTKQLFRRIDELRKETKDDYVYQPPVRPGRRGQVRPQRCRIATARSSPAGELKTH